MENQQLHQHLWRQFYFLLLYITTYSWIGSIYEQIYLFTVVFYVQLIIYSWKNDTCFLYCNVISVLISDRACPSFCPSSLRQSVMAIISIWHFYVSFRVGLSYSVKLLYWNFYWDCRTLKVNLGKIRSLQ